MAATRWALAHAAELGADPARLVLAGDSAGGGLAAHVAQHLRDHGPRPAALQVLFYPATDFTLARTDRDPALAKLLDWPTIDWFATHSLPRGLDRTDPTISPLRAADLRGLPPARRRHRRGRPLPHRRDRLLRGAAHRRRPRACTAISPVRSTASRGWTWCSRPPGAPRSPRPQPRSCAADPVPGAPCRSLRSPSAGRAGPPTADARLATSPSACPSSTAPT